MKVNVLLFDSEKSMVIMIPGADYNYNVPSSCQQNGEDMFAAGKRILKDKLNLDYDIKLNFLSLETGSEQTLNGTAVRNEVTLFSVLDGTLEGKVSDDAVWLKVPYVINMSTDNSEMLRIYYNIVNAYKLINSGRY